jgi:6-pyruvoyltetrahydropterin/6-carboxytetrahydropterin synthase
MKLTLHTETVIDSCHKLVKYDGPCQRLHGHSWFVEVWIQGDSSQKDEVGILFDFGNVKEIKEKYDHFYLNDIPPFNTINPTAENISENIYNELKAKRKELNFKVRVYETYVGKKTYCECGDFE